MVLKGLRAFMVVASVLVVLFVVITPDPNKMSDKDFEQIAIKELKPVESDYTQAELEMKKMDIMTERKEEMKDAMWSKVSNAINFSFIILGATLVVVVGFFFFQFMVDSKKAIMATAGIVGFALFCYIMYATGGTEVPEMFTMDEAKKVADPELRMYTSGNWQLASGAVTGSIILIVVATLGWIGGEVAKIFK